MRWFVVQDRLCDGAYNINIAASDVQDIIALADRTSRPTRHTCHARSYSTDDTVLERRLQQPTQTSQKQRGTPIDRVFQDITRGYTEVRTPDRLLLKLLIERQAVPYSQFPSDISALRCIKDVTRISYTIRTDLSVSVSLNIEFCKVVGPPGAPLLLDADVETSRMSRHVFFTFSSPSVNMGDMSDLGESPMRQAEHAVVTFLSGTCCA